MYIRRKVFSRIEDENGEVRLFSTTDYELDNRLFARRDYEGLDDVQKEVLRKKRSEYAKSLRESRNKLNLKDTKNLLESNGYNTVTSRGTISGGGVKSNFKVTDRAGNLDNYDTLSKRHYKNIRAQQLESVGKAKNIMRDQVLNDFEGEVTKAREAKKYQSTKGIKETVGKPRPEGVKPGNELVNVVKKGEGAAKIGKEKLSKRLIDLVKKNKKPIAIIGGTTAAAGLSALAYKKYKNKNKKGEENK